MPRPRRIDVHGAMLEQRIVPIFTSADPAMGRDVLRACADAGLRVVEFTNRGDRPLRVFSELADHAAMAHPELILGIGTIHDAATAALYLAAGASFVVSSIVSDEVARLCNRRKVAYLPGAGSATEVSLAEELGAEIVKLFPAAALGPPFIRNLLGPNPWSLIMPTGQPSEEGVIRAWFEAGAVAVGVGPGLISDELLRGTDPAALTSRLREIRTWAIAGG
jgi:2-dehydro-3-deoxyphosphogluconate aldolase / (4S)-4-hydroxy-2-oxoglutarate aldolase